MAKATRTSKKQCNEMASAIGAVFYGRYEFDATQKVYVRYEGKRYAFKGNRDAFDWMADRLDEQLAIA